MSSILAKMRSVSTKHIYPAAIFGPRFASIASMEAQIWRRRRGLPVLIVLVAWTSAQACARTLRSPLQQPSTAAVAELWREPFDLEQRDLFHGPGGSEHEPRPVPYTFVARKSTGTNPGYDVRDPQGQLWSVKLGDEAQSEVSTSRVLWALGFHQPPTYYVDRWELSNGAAREQPAGRFRLELPDHKVVGEWSWYDNPFIGSRPFAVLVTVNMLLANWDFKTSNNKVYVVTNEDGRSERRYLVRDLGASLGKARQPRILSWFPFMRHKQGSKNSLEDFEAQGFVRAINGEAVDFDYRGIDAALVDSVTTADLRWTCELLSRLSEQQWLDAFRAGGYTGEQSLRYVRRIQEKIAHARNLVAASA
jgi:hypothetical protein